MKFKQILFFIALASSALAQLPHQVAVLVNESSQASKRAANVFARRCGVPGENLVYLPLPEALFSGRFECTPAQFNEQIYQPAMAAIAERGLAKQITAWVYSVDFPIRVVSSPSDRKQMSIMGLTFLRGELPDLEKMEKGQIVSPLFAGPGPGSDQKLPPRSFDVWSAGLKDQMPLPSMMLGYIGEKGTTIDTVLRCIDDGVRARTNASAPRVLLQKTADQPRSQPREWQFEPTRTELMARGGKVAITTNAAPHQTALSGVLTGSALIRPTDYGSFAPGAMAEHLTSWSAEFQKPQSKCTDWLSAGATVTAGMVTEPYNHWVKFPHARFFVHYAAGCTAMESFYQSIASPMQVLLLGNPLAQIASLPVRIRPIGLSKEITSDLDAAFVVEAKFPVNAKAVYSALLDGKELKCREKTPLVELPFDALGDGYHEVRIVAQALLPGMQVLPGGFIDVPIRIDKKGRSVSIRSLDEGEPSQVVATVATEGDEVPESIYLLWNARTLARGAAGDALAFDERVVGEGPQRIQAVAVYADGMEVRSEPVAFRVSFQTSP